MVTRRDAEDAMHTDLNGEERERTVSVANRTVRPARRATSEGNERSRWSSLAAEVGGTRVDCESSTGTLAWAPVFADISTSTSH